MDKCHETILIVDDDKALRDLLVRYLSENGYSVTAVNDGVEMREALKNTIPQLIILDLMLPGEDGLTLARQLRHECNTPIIILSARGDEVDRIVGLEVGADDYLPKPFNPRELLARIRSVLRRSMNTGSDTAANVSTQQLGPFQLSIQTRQLFKEGEEIILTSGEFTLMEVFANHANRVLNRDALLQLLKGYEHQPFDRSIDVRITRLRRKIEPDASNPVYIRTVWGKGYIFTPSADEKLV